MDISRILRSEDNNIDFKNQKQLKQALQKQQFRNCVFNKRLAGSYIFKNSKKDYNEDTVSNYLNPLKTNQNILKSIESN